MKKYIDVDLLKSELEDLDEIGRLYYMGVFDIINSQPIVDAKEVRHGKWERRIVEKNDVAEMKSVCTECGKTNKRYEPPYCPHCGAKMDGKDARNLFVDCTEQLKKAEAEIERLKKNIDGLNIFTTNHMKVIRLQAIKEFAEKLKKRFYLIAGRCVVDVYHIDNLVKEMTKGE